MGKMALGYGSEFHLLRWLGRHRNEFDKRVMTLFDFDNVHWLDFNFMKDGMGIIPDEELKGVHFLKNEPNYNKMEIRWKEEWPQTGNQMNWDLVGYSIKNNKKTWILVEAKAHVGELEQDCGASKESLDKITKALISTAKNNGIDIHENNLWTKKHYQLANRIYILDLLKRHEIDAKLLNIYFIGDMIHKSRKSPQTKEEWEPEINKMKIYLGIEKCKSLPIFDLFLDLGK